VDFRGFYIFILERGDEIIAAASVRLVFFLLPAVSCDYMALNAVFRELYVQGIHAVECLCSAVESYLGSENP
jgi:hypothetical protein